ncbi:hypothetical protein M409DRAFT_20647 [Zasmidium cellare ATCC 36951]|uniref:Protein kinase domain-containing protein n=1 Tax=Zasmidium cellare ATCC 36951 TaxID=1080233 RepID=A0A6A6CTB9_ZASCE|nr:uncharacterized protein M409DRAFT_20647 [Zasmidium cellare ATCC 36951]KAF2169428.1 hypothetical protein M409DRAFT_20647 [Zasmidium cellare ATCC 36951]
MESRIGPWHGPRRCHKKQKIARVCSGLAEAAIDHFMPIEEFYDSLETFGLRSRHATDPAAIHLRDSVYDKISTLLQAIGRKKWAYLPRTFVVLHQTGLESFMDVFIKEGRTDFYLPYHEGNLPDALAGQDRMRFLHYQDNVLSEREFCGPGKMLESGRAPHLHLKHSSADKFFHEKPRTVLGHGGFATVEDVVGKSTAQHFALKRMARHLFDERKEKRNLQLFQNELNVLQKLKHKHIVKLVGSYTDNRYIGLLTQPVADKNLATFLKQVPRPNEADDRVIRLRSFFGCIATAINYLHNNDTTRVQHKDIKPANILVKGSRVLIADFGTAKPRTEESEDNTESTVGDTDRFFTTKYAAPETASGTRTFASDIWSLGCVFLEMVTVLAGRSIEDLQAFFQSTGSNSTVYQRNQKAIDDWLQQLNTALLASDFPEDAQLTTIVRFMCNQDEAKRLDSRDLVRRIFKLDGPMPYYGLCCSTRSQLSSPARSDSMDSMSTDSSESDSSLEQLEDITEQGTWIPVNLNSAPALIESPSNYISPIVEDSETTIVAYNQPPKLSNHVLEDVTELQGLDSEDSFAVVLEASDARGAPATTDEVTDVAEVDQTGIHLTSVPKETNKIDASNGIEQLPHQDVAVPESTQYVGSNGLACPYPRCDPPKGLALQLFDSFDSLHEHLLGVHLTHDIGRICLLDGSRDVPYKPLTLTPQTGALETIGRKKKNGTDERQVRFSELPDESRPKPIPKQVARPKETNGVYTINAEMPTAPGQADAETTARCTKIGIPPTTFTPSYLLAAKNRFSQLELLSQTRFGKPLFVYGTLMFPSVLRCQAQSFIHTEGTYSSQQGRRIVTGSRDWCNIDQSIQSAAECMTPATLPGYKRFRLSSYSLAYVERAERDDDETPGFLIFGLSSEALACLDHLYEEKGPKHLFDERNSGRSEWSRTRLVRKPATVRLNVVGGESVDVEAEVYVSNVEDAYRRETARPWEMDSFLRGKSFNTLTNRLDGGKRIVEEEIIANTIGTRMVLPGDEFVEKVLSGDQDGLLNMLREHQCVDAPSVKYGTALQAAASKGDVDIMDLLIESGASVNAPGGQYSNPLIAAVVEGHYDAMKLLLRNDAKLFVPGGRYISALYQAVDFDRVEMAHALLEKGAWLTKDYREVLDLAAERHNDEMYDELVRYDVLGLHRNDKQVRDRFPTSASDVAENPRSLSTEQYTSIGAVCLVQAVRLYGQPGKWTGRKGVKVLKAGIERGLDGRILEKIRPHIHSFPAIQKFFAGAMGVAFNGRFKPVSHSDPTEAWVQSRMTSTSAKPKRRQGRVGWEERPSRR